MEVKWSPTPVVLNCRSDDGSLLKADLVPGDPDRPILLVHGFWRARRHPAIVQIRDELARTGATVVIPDLRGHGDSEGRFTFNRSEWKDLGGIAESARLRHSVSVVALSMGSAIAISAAARGLIDVDRMLLISPVSRFTELGPDVVEMLRGGHLEYAQRCWKPRVDLRQLLTCSERVEAEDQAGKVTADVTLIHARGDWLVSHRHGERLAARLPKCDLHILDERSGRRMHADRLVRQAWPIFGPLLRRFAEGAASGRMGALFRSSCSTI